MASPLRESQAPRSKDRSWVKLLIALLFVGVAVFFVVRAPTDAVPSAPNVPAGATSAADGGPSEAEPATRCRSLAGRSTFRVAADGSGPAKSALEPATDAGEPELRYAPFAVVLGRGAVTSRGYAVGVKRDTADGAVAEVVLVDQKSGVGRTLSLGRLRGDVEAPLVIDGGDAILAAALEPNASGFSLRLARMVGDEVSFVAELPQDRDESLAFDLAVGENSVVVAWDETTRDAERGRVVIATLERDELSVRESARPISSDDTDAEAPRLVARAGGFWLVYVARRSVELPPRPSDEDLGRDPKQERYAAEMIEHSWLEVMPLEPGGAAAGPARPLTGKDGHVQAFDVEGLADDGLVVAWRDDDTPTGAQGGRVSLVVVRSSGIGESRVLLDHDVGLGVPNLLPQWLSLAATGGQLRLAPLDSQGHPVGVIAVAPSLGVGQLIAADAETLLLARPAGKAVELEVVQCDRTPVPEPPDPLDDGGRGGAPAAAAPTPSGSAP